MKTFYKISNGRAIVGSTVKTIPDGYTEYILGKEPLELISAQMEERRDLKKREIRAAFQKAAFSPVTVAERDYNGGIDSALRLDAAKRLAELVGDEDVIFFDINNKQHSLSFAEAEDVIKAIGGAYKKSYFHKQDLMLAIDAAGNPAELEKVVW